MFKNVCQFTVFIFIINVTLIKSLHVQGTWKTNNFFMFLSKFGFQRTEPHDVAGTQGYIYGNITSKDATGRPLTLAVLDSQYFMEFYANRTKHRESACDLMFRKIDTIAFDSECHTSGREDFLRRIPCPEGEYCVDEDEASNVISGYQFTYKVVDQTEPRFWYISFVSCYRNSTNSSDCHWNYYDQPEQTIEYDIWFVNGNPSEKNFNPFEHQFSFEKHDVVEIYLVGFFIYILLFPVWIYAFTKQKHPITKLITACFVLEFSGIACNCVHVLKFAFDGRGVYWLSVIGNAIDLFAQCLFMLILLFIAKGWAITTNQLRGKYVLFSIWGVYTGFNAVMFIWNLTEIDVISNTDEWQTWPGYLILGFRLIFMMWFLYELRITSSRQPDHRQLDFIQHFGAGFLVWFTYLPVLALISTQVSALWRLKTILCITIAADFLSFAVLVHLLWPSWTVLRLIKQDANYAAYELESTGLLLNDDDDDEDINFDATQHNGHKVSSDEKLNNNSKSNGHIPTNSPKLDQHNISAETSFISDRFDSPKSNDSSHVSELVSEDDRTVSTSH